MNEKTGTGVSSEKAKVKESQSRSVTPSLDTPSGAGLGVPHLAICSCGHFTYSRALCNFSSQNSTLSESSKLIPWNYSTP